jgi:hypothetical protein
MAAAVEGLFSELERFLGRFAEALRLAFGAALLRDLVQFGFGALDLSEGGNVLTRIERAFHEIAAHADQGAQQREVVDLSGKVPRSDHRRARTRQLGEISRPADDHPEIDKWREEMARVYGLAEVIVAKQRHGSTGKVRLKFDSRITKFSDLVDEGYMPEIRGS